MATITKPPTEETTTATVEIKPPKFMSYQKVQLSPEAELEDVEKRIDEAKKNGLRSLKIKQDLQDYAWQKLSQKGYKITRRVLERLVQTNANADELDQNRIEFEINLVEFNRTDK